MSEEFKVNCVTVSRSRLCQIRHGSVTLALQKRHGYELNSNKTLATYYSVRQSKVKLSFYLHLTLRREEATSIARTLLTFKNGLIKYFPKEYLE